MSRGKQSSIRVQRETRIMALQGYSAKAIHERLFPNKLDDEDHVSRKTIERLVNESKVDDESGPWSILDADEREAALVAEVALWGVDALDNDIWPSRALAKWIYRVRVVAPDIPLNWALFTAGLYQQLQDQGRTESRILDVTLAASPWSSEEQARDWASAVRKWGWTDSKSPHYDEFTIQVLEWLSRVGLIEDGVVWSLTGDDA